MTYVPPFRRDDDFGAFQRGYSSQNQQQQGQQGYNQNFQQQDFGQGNFQRAHHGDRRAGPHPGFNVRPNFGGQSHGGPSHTQNFHQSQHQTQAQGYTPYTRDEKPEDEIFKEHSAGINFDQYEAIQVSMTPNDTAPVETFSEMTLSPMLMENVSRCRYTKPTPVQKYGIPIVLKGKDLMACAQTGSGKTAAYLIPAVNHVLVNGANPPVGRQAVPSALILAPTRELSIQIYEEGRKFTFRTGLRCVVVYGGADPRYQINELARGCHVLVATPGRLLDMFSRNNLKFSGIRYLVLDEADRMLDMGFEPQIRQIVQGPESDMPRTGARQTLMYSATFPREIQQLAREFLHNHTFLQVGRVGSTTENITQSVRWVEDAEKRDTLLTLLTDHGDKLVLVFVEKKRDADYLERYLRQCRISCASIHGDRVQREREEALAYFKAGVCRVLVATDVASRGLDIPNVGVVIQYDLPSNIDDYVHRIGRTGRAGKTGVAYAFFNEKNRNIVDEIVPLLRETNQEVDQHIASMVTPKRQPQQSRGRGRGYGRGGFGFGGGRGGYGNNNNNHSYGGHGTNQGGYGGYNSFGASTNNHQNFHQQYQPTHNHGIFQPPRQ
jgi:ATP-dependent RNA helicase DDX3X